MSLLSQFPSVQDVKSSSWFRHLSILLYSWSQVSPIVEMGEIIIIGSSFHGVAAVIIIASSSS